MPNIAASAPLEIITVPCLQDNYAFLLHDAESGETAVVDVPEAGPIAAELAARGWTLSHVLLTHHHWDHVDGLADLLAAHPARVFGAAADAERLPPLDVALSEGDTLSVGAHVGAVIDVSGHTLNHIAFHFADSAALFTADSLMALGCGRLFEGTPAQMFDSLSKLASLPAESVVYSGHEYTRSNAAFALSVEPGNAALQARATAIDTARANNIATVPSTLEEELATNPFLRSHIEEVKDAAGLPNGDPAEVFAKVRSMKDTF